MDLEAGDEVTCGFCGAIAKVESKSNFNGSPLGYFLSCGHRNAVCKRHKKMVMDASDTAKEVHPMCADCVQEQDEAFNNAPPPPSW